MFKQSASGYHRVEAYRELWILGRDAYWFWHLTAILSADVPIRWLTLLLGVITVMFAVLSLWRKPPRLSDRSDRSDRFDRFDRFDRLAQVLTGIFSGAIGGLAGIWAPPIIIYLTSGPSQYRSVCSNCRRLTFHR